MPIYKLPLRAILLRDESRFHGSVRPIHIIDYKTLMIDNKNIYPDRWIAIRDAQMEGADIVSGIVEAVLTDDEIGEHREQAAPPSRLLSEIMKLIQEYDKGDSG